MLVLRRIFGTPPCSFEPLELASLLVEGVELKMSSDGVARGRVRLRIMSCLLEFSTGILLTQSSTKR